MGRISQNDVIQKLFLNKDLLKANLTKVDYDHKINDDTATFLKISSLVKLYFKNVKITTKLVKEIKNKLIEEYKNEERINVNEVCCLDSKTINKICPINIY